jgi:hypothetical protein
MKQNVDIPAVRVFAFSFSRHSPPDRSFGAINTLESKATILIDHLGFY